MPRYMNYSAVFDLGQKYTISNFNTNLPSKDEVNRRNFAILELLIDRGSEDI